MDELDGHVCEVQERRKQMLKNKNEKNIKKSIVDRECYMSKNCYIKIDNSKDAINQPITINISDIEENHVMETYGYVHEIMHNTQLNISNDLINEITMFYAKPLTLKIQYKRKGTKYIFYCPIDDSFKTLLHKIENRFTMSRWSKIRGIRYMRQFVRRRTQWDKLVLELDTNKVNILFADTRDAEEDEYMKRHFVEIIDSSDEDSSSVTSSSDSTSESKETELTFQDILKHKLKTFDKRAAVGEIFLHYDKTVYTKPKDATIRVTFNNKFIPEQIIWDNGTELDYIRFSDILYIAKGHWTPTFDRYRMNTNPKVCFSVVGKNKILDLQGQSEEVVELWVKGLRRLIGHSDEKDDQLALEGLEMCRTKMFETNTTSHLANEVKETDLVSGQKSINQNTLIVGGIVVIGIALLLVWNRRRIFGQK